MDTGGDHMEIPQSENSGPKNIESSLPLTSLVPSEITQDRDKAISELEATSPSVRLDIAGTNFEQSPRILDSSSLSTTSYVQTEITEAQDEPISRMEPPLALGSVLIPGDESSETVEPSLFISSLKNSKANPFIENLLKTYPNPNPSLQDTRESEEKLKEQRSDLIKLKEQLSELIKLNRRITEDLDKIPGILAQADDAEGFEKIVDTMFQVSDAINFLTKRLQETHAIQEWEFYPTLERVVEIVKCRIDIYTKLFDHALNDTSRKRPEVPATKEKGIGGNPLQYYEPTKFTVFLINKVQGEEDIMTTTLVLPEITVKSKTLIISCVDRYVKETLGICICLVLKGLVEEAKELFRDIVQYIRSGDIIHRGRVYNYALRKAEELVKVRKFLAGKFVSQQCKKDVETRDLLNWPEMDQHDIEKVKVHNFFVDLFLKDGELMQMKDQLTFAWMERYDFPYLIKCVWKCHQLLHNKVDKLKVCGIDKCLEDDTPDNWRKVQLYVEYALHSCAMSCVAGVQIIPELFKLWPKLDVNASYKGVTTFHIAAYKGHEKVVKVLLRRKDFDINVCTGRSITVKSLKKVFARGEPILDTRALSKGILLYEGGLTYAYKDCEDVIKDLIRHGEIEITFQGQLKIEDFFQSVAYSGKNWNRNRWKMSTHQTALHIATKQGHVSVVKLLCDKKLQMTMQYNEEDDEERTALDIIYEKLSTSLEDSDDHASFSEIKYILLSLEDVQKGIDRLYRHRQVLVDATNTILVGAALIASVTFAGWLQPPLGYAQYYDLATPLPAPPGTYDSFIGVQGNIGIKAFALFNSLSFFFAIATVIAGADAAFPMRKSAYIGEVIKPMQSLLQRAIKFLIISLVCVLGAFGSAAVVILPPHVYFRKDLVLTIFIGGGVCGVALWQLLSRHSKKVQALNGTILRFIGK